METSSSALRDFLETPARQASVLDEVAHRPWPPPVRPWVQAQTWNDLLFAHWRVEAEQLRTLVPAPLTVEEFDGSGWLGMTPFRVSGLRIRGLPPAPLLSSFNEVNVRTYVSHEGKPGIWFFSLDANSQLAVEAARRTYFLPYHRARITCRRSGGWVEYACARVAEEGRPFVLEGRYRPVGEAAPPADGSLDEFLTERYCLYSLDDEETLHRAEIHHPPWPLHAADAEIALNTMAPRALDLGNEAPLFHFSARQDVVIWSPHPVEGQPAT